MAMRIPTLPNLGSKTGLETEEKKGSPSYLVNIVTLRSNLPPPDPEQAKIDSRNDRYSLLFSARKKIIEGQLPEHQIRSCSCKAIPKIRKTKAGEKVETGMPGTIQVQSRFDEEAAKAKHHYYGILRCASPLVCPVCGAIIAVRRALELVEAGTYMLNNGYRIAMLTQTAAHNSGTNLHEFAKQFQAAQREMKSWTAYKKWKIETGLEYTVRSLEITDDNPEYAFRGKVRRTGWHFHAHTILFFRSDTFFNPERLQDFTKDFQMIWKKALERQGLSASLERGALFSIPDQDHAYEADAAVAAGKNEKDVKALLGYVAKTTGWEAAGGRFKEGRGERRVSAWRIQRLALTTRPDLLPRYAEYMQSVKGLSWLRWSKGLKDLCNIKDQSDEDILVGEQGEIIVWEFLDDKNFFRTVARRGWQGLVLEAADRAGRDGIAMLLDKP